MKISQVGAMVYTVRDFLTSAKQIAETFSRIRKIGYESVELFGMESIADRELATLLRDAGLRCVSLHASPKGILENPESVVARPLELGCSYVTYPWPAEVSFTEESVVKEFARKLSAAGAAMKKHGLTLLYHNHHLEFRRVGKCSALELIFQETSGDVLQAELDTFWVQNGGGNVERWCERLSGRLPVLHMKDYTIDRENKPAFAEVGSGNLDWNQIIASAEKAGCRHFLVEQDTCPGDPFDSLQQSFNHIKSHLAN
jgi:sugar phosphate isomerase/epimerase